MIYRWLLIFWLTNLAGTLIRWYRGGPLYLENIIFGTLIILYVLMYRETIKVHRLVMFGAHVVFSATYTGFFVYEAGFSGELPVYLWPGCALIALGMHLNNTVITANGFYMPVDPKAVELKFQRRINCNQPPPGPPMYCWADDRTRWRFLCDRIYLSRVGMVVSLGDIVAFSGMVAGLSALMLATAWRTLA